MSDNLTENEVAVIKRKINNLKHEMRKVSLLCNRRANGRLSELNSKLKKLQDKIEKPHWEKFKEF